MRRNKWIAWLLVFVVLFTTFTGQYSVAYAEDASREPVGSVTLSIEKFTLGQGYIREPIKVPYYSGDNVAKLLARVLGEGNYKHSGSVEQYFYLSKIKDPNAGEVNVPPYILNEAGSIGTRSNEDWLGEFDYTPMSGWMYTANNEFPPYGMADYIPQNGDVIRVQFTVYGYGADLGDSWGSGFIPYANKTGLTAEVAELNSAQDKAILLTDEKVRGAYAQAYAVLQQMESSQEAVDQALLDLRTAVNKYYEPDTEPPVIAVGGLQDNQVVLQDELSFSVTVTDNVYLNVVPVVTLNDVVVPGNGDQYAIKLLSGHNTIKVTAVDGAGNSSNKSYHITYKAPIAEELTPVLQRNLVYLVKSVAHPTFGTLGGEWSVLSLARAEYDVPSDYYSNYYNNVLNKVKHLLLDNQGKLHTTKSTEHSRLILALTSIGEEHNNVARYDISRALAEYSYVTKQGINGPIFALMAFDSHSFDIPKASNEADQTTRDNLIQYILDHEIDKGASVRGGWALAYDPNSVKPQSAPDVDITSMAIQSLAPYYNARPEVRDAVDRALAWLSKAQTADGGFASQASYGSTNTESIAQVIVALTSLGIDPHKDARFVKDGNSALEALMSFALPEGGFLHLKSGANDTDKPKADAMATDQGTYALVAYDRFLKGSSSLYNMNEVTLAKPAETEGPNLNELTILPSPTAAQPKIVIPNDAKAYLVPIPEDYSSATYLEIPADKAARVYVSLLANHELPKLEAVKGNVSLVIPQHTKVIKGDPYALEMLTATDTTKLKELIGLLVPPDKKLEGVAQAFTIGGSKEIEFDQYVTLTLKGMKGHDAAYIQNGKSFTIQHYALDEQGAASGEHEYSYDSGNDLIIKTKHFTDYVVYKTSAILPPDDGGTVPQPQPIGKVTFSVDKFTINKGEVVAPIMVDLLQGDTVWTVTKRVLDSKSINYKYEWTEKYNSVYVQSIDGDGEFDHGTGSGWMYNVNSSYPGYGASRYTLSNGDRIQWRYTTNLGTDLGAGPAIEGKPPVTAPPIVLASNDRTPVINVPQDIVSDYVLNITQVLKATDNITIHIPDVSYKVMLNLKDVANDIPKITAVKGNASLVLEKGTALQKGDTTFELFSALKQNSDQVKLKQQLISSFNDSNGKGRITAAMVIGNESKELQLSKPYSLTFKGGKDQLPGYMAGGTFTPIQVYDSEQAALAALGTEALGTEGKIAYSFRSDNDLVVRSNFATTLISYEMIGEGTNTEVIDIGTWYSDAKSISAWANEAIITATEQGLIQGSNGKFNPQSSITRAEFTKVLAAVLELDLKIANRISYVDVAEQAWYYPYVNAASQEGIVTGSGKHFRPNDKLTREQMAAILVRALQLKQDNQASGLKDMEQVSAWARGDVAAIIASGLMKGDSSQFNPQGVVTREMAAVVAVRAYEKRNSSAAQQAGQTEQTEQVGTADKQPQDLSLAGNQSSANPAKLAARAKIKPYIQSTAAFLQAAVTDPVVASVGGEWTVIGLARSGIQVPEAYYAKYVANLETTLKASDGKLHRVKYTEYDRVILALSAIGKEIKSVAGYDLREPLADYTTLIKQGINGPIFALIALDSKAYDIPLVTNVKTQTTRERLIDYILNREIAGGGWALGEQAAASDPDITAMAIQGLTPYYATNAKVKAAIDRGLSWLSAAQQSDGGYVSGGASNSESVAQVIVALTGMGIDPHTDSRYVKGGSSALTALLSYAAPQGGFYHIKQGGADNGGAKPGEVDLMATDQALYALVAYDRYANGLTRLYDMSDVKVQ